MTTNNEYLKQIWINTCTPSPTERAKTHSDNYYLKAISISCGNTYTGTVCNGRLYKDIAEDVTGDTYTGNHFNNYYLRRMALEYVEQLEQTNDNYLLSILADNMGSPSRISIEADSSSILVGGSVDLTITVEYEGQLVDGGTVTIKDGETTLGTATTDSSGEATYTVSNLSVGSHSLTVTYEDISSDALVIEVLKPISLSVSSSSIIIDSSVTLSATVLDSDCSPLSNVTVTFEEDWEELDTATTNSNGVATLSYTPLTATSHTITAVYDEYSDEQTVTVSKHTSSITCTIGPTNINYGGTLTALGTLYIDGETAPSGKTVDIYNGNTKLGSATTASNGAFRYDKNNVTTTGTMSVKAVFESDSTHIGYETDPTTVIVAKRTPSLTINTPTIVYDDPFTVTGTLKTSANGSAISGASVTLTYSINSELPQTVDGTTNSSGTVTFNMSAPDGMGVYSLQLSYDGNSEFNATTSSLVEEDVNKKGTILGLNSPVSGAVVSTGDLFVRGTLTDDDASPKALAGKTIVAKIGNTTIGTFTTYGNDGIFSGSILNSELSIGYNTIDFYFDGTSEYEGDSVTGISVRKVAPSYTAIDISVDNSILSYADSDSATITAQLVDSHDSPVAISGVSIELYKDNVLWDTISTDSDGKVQKTYNSTGAGDIEFGATDGTLQLKTYSIEDCVYAPKLDGSEGVSRISTWTPSIMNNTLTNGCGYLNQGFDNTIDWILTFEYYVTGSSNGCLLVPSGLTQRDKFFVQIWQTTSINFRNPNTSITPSYNTNVTGNSYNQWNSIKITKENNEVNVYVNDVLQRTVTISTLSDYSTLFIGLDKSDSSNFSSIRNIKIKPL